MECRCWSLAVCLLGMSTLVGCGASDAPSSTTAGAGKPAMTAEASDLKPAQVVSKFLEAVRKGDDALASQMLTDLARKETEKHELVVAPPGSDTAKFMVGDTEFVVKDELAHVASSWTDIGEDGQPHTDDIVWALRLDTTGWRIAGMATRIFPNEPPLLLDFEKPEEMIEQQRLAEEEMQRRARVAEEQATKVSKPATGNVLRQ